MQSIASADHADIHAVAEALRAAVNCGDVDGILVCWMPDGTLMPPHHACVHGHAAIADDFRRVFTVRRLTFTFTGSTITCAGGVALERLSYSAVVTSVAGGAESEDVGKGLHVYTRQPDGRWRMAQDIWNSDLPSARVTEHAVLHVNAS